MTEKQERHLLAMMAILASPDLPDLLGLQRRPRGRAYTYARDPLRDRDAIKRDLATAYVAWLREDRNLGVHDISCVVSVRKQPKYPIARRAS